MKKEAFFSFASALRGGGVLSKLIRSGNRSGLKNFFSGAYRPGAPKLTNVAQGTRDAVAGRIRNNRAVVRSSKNPNLKALNITQKNQLATSMGGLKEFQNTVKGYAGAPNVSVSPSFSGYNPSTNVNAPRSRKPLMTPNAVIPNMTSIPKQLTRAMR